MYTVGIDAGSVTTKAMLLNGGDRRHVIRPACCNPSQARLEAFKELLGRAGLVRGTISPA